jgi:hypothetical protein
MDAEFFAPWTQGAFGANLSDGTNSAEEAGMPAKGRVRQLTILLAVAALLVTAPGPTAGAGAQGAAG